MSLKSLSLLQMNHVLINEYEDIVSFSPPLILCHYVSAPHSYDSYSRFSRSRCFNSLRTVNPSYFNAANNSMDSALKIPKPDDLLRIFAHSILSWTLTHCTSWVSLASWSHCFSNPFVIQILMAGNSNHWLISKGNLKLNILLISNDCNN